MNLRGGSLGLRLLGLTLLTLVLALAGAHAGLSSLFRAQALAQFDETLSQQLDQLTARLEFDAQGRPALGPRGLSDPRWDRPYSGLYWQVDALGAEAARPVDPPSVWRRAVLRSRSLWDVELQLPQDVLAPGEVHRHEVAGPSGQPLRVAERLVQEGNAGGGAWRLIVAADRAPVAAAIDRFDGVLAVSLAGLGVLLGLAALAQVALGLAPLRALGAALQRVQVGQELRLQGRFPAEVQPLVDGFNGLLDRQAESAERARAVAGNLAHALKTPLAILGQAARRGAADELPALVDEQVRVAQRHLQWHLARARAVASRPGLGQRVALEPLVHALLHTLQRLHDDRHLDLSGEVVPVGLAFAGEEQDLQEMVGNLVDNACRHARTRVEVRVFPQADGMLAIEVEDDGPGIPPERRQEVLRRGVRLDEQGPGSGLGLAIVVDLARLYGGDLTLDSPGGADGLCARLRLPAAAPSPAGSGTGAPVSAFHRPG